MANDSAGISQLKSLLDWQLRKGSHKWPGPDGGTCIIEAAIVVAGLPYRRVLSVDDAPADFSWVVAEYLLLLNDRLNDEARQQLIPFVTRLPGSADHYSVENQRLYLIITRVAKGLLPSLLETVDMPDEADACRTMRDGPGAFFAFRLVVEELRAAGVLAPARSNSTLAAAVDVARWVGTRVVKERSTQLDRLLSIADEALKLGNRAEPIEAAVARERLERARLRQRALRPTHA